MLRLKGSKKPWMYSEASDIIKPLVDVNKSFGEVENYLNPQCDEDTRFILAVYTKLFMDFICFKGKQYINYLFLSANDDLIIKWVEVVYGKKADDEFHKLLSNAMFFKNLEDIQARNRDYKFSNFYEQMKLVFESLFMTMKNLKGDAGIYRCLLYCENHTKHSTIYCDAVEKLWKKFQFEENFLNLEIDETAEIDPEHHRLSALVDNFEPSSSIILKELIKSKLKPTVYELYSEGQHQILHIKGYTIKLSTIYDKIIQTISTKKSINKIVINAMHNLFLDIDITLPGINLDILVTEKLAIQCPIKCNLSGNNAIYDETMKFPANNGNEKGEDGSDGKHGKAGQSSGSLNIFAKNFEGKNNLSLILNGGNGTNGQDGGNGVEGEDGIGLDFEKTFNLGHRIAQGAKFATLGTVSRIFDNKIEKVVDSQGIIHEKSDSAYNLSTHTIVIHKGTGGKPGGKGGKPGRGGEGGKKGSYFIKIDNKESPIDQKQVFAKDGDDGKPGLPGLNRAPGQDGWDIGLINSTFGERYPYGQYHDEKLRIEYTSVKAKGSVYVKERDEGEGSQRFAKIVATPVKKKKLEEHEKRTQNTTDLERSGEAIATVNYIDTQKASNEYQGMTQSINSTIEQQQMENEIASEIENNFIRIIEYLNPLIDYVPKTRHKTPIYSDENLKTLDLNEEYNDEFWKTTTTKSNLEELIMKNIIDGNIKQRLMNKNVIVCLRSKKKNIKICSAKSDFTNELPLDENCNKYYMLFNRIKRLQINGKPINLFFADIQYAFNKRGKNGSLHRISLFINQLSPVSIEIHNLMSDEIFEKIMQEYNALPDALKDCNCKVLFFYLKLSVILTAKNALSKSLSNNTEKTINDFSSLEMKRTKQASKFINKLHTKYEYFITLLMGSVHESFELNLTKLFSYFGVNSENKVSFLKQEFKTLCQIFPSTGMVFMKSLLLVFESEGCHIDLTSLKYLIDTVFNACKNYGVYNCYIFPSTLLITEQEKWIDEFFVFNIESALKKTIRDKEFMKTLKEFVDENVKILISNKLRENCLKENDLTSLIEELKGTTTLYPHLKHKPINEWLEAMKEINISNKMESHVIMNSLPKDSKLTILFWCRKIAERFGTNVIDNIWDELIAIERCEKESVGRFMQRLCNAENTYDQPLEDILNAAIECLKFPQKPFDNNDSNYSAARNLLRKDITNKNELRDNETLKKLCENSNSIRNYELLMEPSMTLLTKGCSIEIQNIIEECVTFIKLKKYSFHEIEEKLTIEWKNSSDQDVFLLEVVDKIIFELRKFNLRYTQKAAVLFALQHNDKGILQQISTGEGKTLIIATLSIINAFKGRTVNIITSSPVLAKRDVDDSPSGCKDLYQAFAMTADHICYNSALQQKNAFKNNIVYGDLASYQRVYLMDTFYSTKTMGNRNFDIIIVDEVDSLLLDNGLNTLYLSHTNAELEMLHTLLLHIWDCVNIHVESGNSCDNEEFYQQIYSHFFSIIHFPNLHEVIEISENEVTWFKDILICANIINDKGVILMLQKELLLEHFECLKNHFEISKTQFLNYYDKCLLMETKNVSENENSLNEIIQTPDKSNQAANIMLKNMLMENGLLDNNGILKKIEKIFLHKELEKIQNRYETIIFRFIHLYDSKMNYYQGDIPEHLFSYVETHLKELILNAETAYHMKEGEFYKVDVPPASMRNKDKIEPKVVIIDRDTGVDLPTTQWHKGLHQFLQLKHCLNLTSLSTKAVFISNVSFLKKFNCIYGFSGTLGAEAEREQIKNIYELESIILPSAYTNLFYEEYPIVSKTKESYFEEIFYNIKKKLDENRSVLIIGESVNQIRDLHKKVSRLAESKLTHDLEAFRKACVYKSDSDIFIYGDGKEIECKTIIWATLLAGRGIDLRITNKLKESGGLHVIIAFLPRNIRIEEQAFGRAARSGEPGTAQLIIHSESANNDRCNDIQELKWIRNEQEKERVQRITEYYNNKIKPEEKCFEIFCEKFRQITKANKESEYDKLLSSDLLDQWALWLDQSEYIWLEKEKRIKAAGDFCEDLKMVEPQRPLNLLNYAILKIIDKNYDDAEKLLNKMASKFPTYLPEAKYYLAFVYSKQNDRMWEVIKSLPFLNGNNPSGDIEIAKEIKDLEAETTNNNPLKTVGNELSSEADMTNITKKTSESKDIPHEVREKDIPLVTVAKDVFPQVETVIKDVDLKDETKIQSQAQACLTEEELHSKIEESLKIAKNGFEKRKKFLEYFKIVNKHNKIEENRIFQSDIFLQQHMDTMVDFNSVIESIDTFLGKGVKPENFITDEECFETTYYLFHRFSDSQYFGKNTPITKFKIKENNNKENFKNYCQNNGVSITSVTNALCELQKNGKVEINELLEIFEIPTWEGLWEELKKKNLLTNVQMHTFIDISKCFSKFNKKIDQIYKVEKTNAKFFQYFYAKEDNWVEVNNERIKTCNKEWLNILFENNILIECEAADLSEKINNIDSIQFDRFSFVTADNLILYGISQDESILILNNLIEKGIMTRYDNKKYCLSPTFKIEDFIIDIDTWYAQIVYKMIEHKLAFTLTYSLLRTSLKNNIEFFCHLSNKTDENILTELIDINVLENTNINLNGLNKTWTNANFIRKGWNAFWNSEATNNISNVLKDAEKLIKNNFEPNDNKSVSKSKQSKPSQLNDENPSPSNDNNLIQKLFNPNVEKLKMVFYQNAPFNQKFKIMETELIPIKKVNDVGKVSIFTTHGLKYFIKFGEMKWSKDTVKQLSKVATAATIQIALGCGAFFIPVPVLNGYVAKVVISEGMSDGLYFLKGLITGRCDNYITHKLISLPLSLTVCGVFESAKYLSKLQPEVKALIRPVLNKGGVAVKSMIDFFKKAVIPAMAALVKISFNKNIFARMDEVVPIIVLEINLKINEILEKAFESSIVHYLQSLIKSMFLIYGLQEKEMINDDGNNIISTFVDATLFKLFHFIVEKFKEALKAEIRTPNEKKLEGRIFMIISSPKFEDFLNVLKEKIELGYNKLAKNLTVKIEERNVYDSSAIQIHCDEEADGEANKLILKLKTDLKEKCENLLKEEVKIMDYENEKFYQQQLNSIVHDAYSEFRKLENTYIFTSYNEETNFDSYKDQELNLAKDEFYKNLMEIQETTLDPEVFVILINTNIKLYDYGKKAIEKLISTKLNKAVIIKGANDDVSVETTENVITIVNHNKSNYFSEENSNIYLQLIQNIPELFNHFPSLEAFKDVLTQQIANDSNFYTRQAFDYAIERSFVIVEND